MALRRWRSGRGCRGLIGIAGLGAGLRRHARGAKLSVAEAGRTKWVRADWAAEEVELDEGG